MGMGTIKVLDMFCGAGGASGGFKQLGWEVVGMDIKKQPHYPFEFIQKDCMEVVPDELQGFDFIWASPPCQRYSVMTKRWGREGNHPDLVAPVRKLLRESRKPYCIENVVGAPLENPVMLCGSMFGLQTKYGSQLRRHRLLECNFPVAQMECKHNKGSVIGVYGGGQHPDRRVPATIGIYGHAGGGSTRDGLAFFSTQDRKDAMGIEWMVGDELSQAIPPAYSRYIGEQWLFNRKEE
jgi:DNA (cytosine-5)-methyltransferase 1